MTPAELRAARKARLAQYQKAQHSRVAEEEDLQSPALEEVSEELPEEELTEVGEEIEELADDAEALSNDASELAEDASSIADDVSGDELVTEEEVEDFMEEELSEETSMDSSEELVAPLVTEEELGEEVEIAMVLHGEASDNPHWVIIANGNPIAKVALQDQTKPEEIRNMFTKANYPAHVKEAISKVGLKSILRSLHARPYVLQAKKTTLVAEIRKQEAVKARKAYLRKVAKTNESFLENVQLVLEAMHKGFILENPIKDELWVQMKRAGVHNPTPIIQKAFGRRGREFFALVLSKGREWGSMDAGARQQLASQIAEMKPFDPQEEEQVEEQVEAKVASTARPSFKNVPLTTYGVGKTASELKEKFRKGLHNRVGAGRRGQ